MKKQEAIEKAQVLMSVLYGLPNDRSVDIMSASVMAHFGMKDTQVYLTDGIEIMSKYLDLPIEHVEPGDGYIHRRIHSADCEYIQLDKADG